MKKNDQSVWEQFELYSAYLPNMIINSYVKSKMWIYLIFEIYECAVIYDHATSIGTHVRWIDFQQYCVDRNGCGVDKM